MANHPQLGFGAERLEADAVSFLLAAVARDLQGLARFVNRHHAIGAKDAQSEALKKPAGR